MAENELVQVDDFVWVNPDQLTHVRIKLNVGGSTTFRLDYMAGDAVLGTVCSDDDKALLARVELYKRGLDVNARSRRRHEVQPCRKEEAYAAGRLAGR